MRGRPFQKGQVANPKGRPKGARNRLETDVIEKLCASWLEHGEAALEELRTKDVKGYVTAVLALVPKESRVNADVPAALDDGELSEVVRRVTDILHSPALRDRPALLPH